MPFQTSVFGSSRPPQQIATAKRKTPLHAGCSGITPILPHFHDRSCQSRCIIGKHIRAIWRTPSSLPRCASNERRFPYTPRNNLYRLCQPHHYSTRLACLASRYTVTLSTHATLSSVSKHRGNCHNCGSHKRRHIGQTCSPGALLPHRTGTHVESKDGILSVIGCRTMQGRSDVKEKTAKPQ